MNELSFNRVNLIGTKLIVVNADLKAIDTSKPIILTSNITGRSVKFVYDAAITNEEYERNEGWDGEEYHMFFTDTEGRGLTLNVWDSPNFH